MKKTIASLVMVSSLLALCGCTSTPSSNTSTPNPSVTPSSEKTSSVVTPSSVSKDDAYDINDVHYYDNVEKRASFDTSNSNNFKEDFDGTMSDDIFYALEGAWHNTDAAAPHNGMKNRNLFYTTDEDNNTLLAIRGRGFYNRDADFEKNKPEGGCIITKEHLGPGRYEIEMSAMPREGGVTAMWTYCTTTGSEYTSQNEIDIELGGNTNGTQYESFWATTWTTKTNKQTDTIDVTEDLHLNDGKLHKYTFDWYTDYQSERRVDWFIDGKWINSISGSMVPEHEMPLWIGLWFPPLWPGNPAFEEDYMLVDSINYTAFNADQYYESCRSEPGYLKQVPSEVGIKTIDYSVIKNLNKLSNGEFDVFANDTRDNSYYGWNVETASRGTVTQVENGDDGKAFRLTAGVPDPTVNYYGEYLNQKITNAYGGYKYDFSIDAQLLNEASEGNIELYFLTKSGATVKSEIIPVDSTNIKTYSKSIVVPEGTYSIQISITAEKGTVTYDNASLVYLGCD